MDEERRGESVYKTGMGEPTAYMTRFETWSPKTLNPYAPSFSSTSTPSPMPLGGGTSTPDMFQCWRSTEKLQIRTNWSSRDALESRNSSSDMGTPRDSHRSRSQPELDDPSTIEAVISTVFDDRTCSVPVSVRGRSLSSSECGLTCSSPSPPPEIVQPNLHERNRIISPRLSSREQSFRSPIAIDSIPSPMPIVVSPIPMPISSPARPTMPLNASTANVWHGHGHGHGTSAFKTPDTHSSLSFDDIFFVPLPFHAAHKSVHDPQSFPYSVHVISDDAYAELSVQRCPICLGHDHGQEQLLELRCRAFGCRHLVHSSCFNSDAAAQKLLTTPHSLHYVRAQSPTTLLNSPYSEMFTNRKYLVEMSVSHIIGSVPEYVYRPNCAISSIIEPGSGCETLMLRVHEPHLNPMLLLNMAIGGITCKCQLANGTPRWCFTSNYDLTSYPPDAIAELQLVDNVSESRISIILEPLQLRSGLAWTMAMAKLSLNQLTHSHSHSHSSVSPFSEESVSSSSVHIRPIRGERASSSSCPLQPLSLNFGSAEVRRTRSSLDAHAHVHVHAHAHAHASPPLSTRSAPSFTDSELEQLGLHVDGNVDEISAKIEGHVSRLAKSQCGSRFLQDLIREDEEPYISLIFREVYDDLPNLMTDLFGNYLCQRLISKCSHEQRQQLLLRLAPCIVEVSCDRQGTRVMQKMIQYTSTQKQRQILIDALSTDVVTLMQDAHGSYVINAMLEHIPLKYLGFILDAACTHCDTLAVNQHGLCVLKTCMSLVDKPDLDRLVSKITERLLDCVNNQYGNYLIQHLLSVGKSEAGTKLHVHLRGHYCELSRQKFSSNVVEKCLAIVPTEVRHEIIAELTDNRQNIATLLQDSYGNYVMQNALAVSGGVQAQMLVELIRPFIKTLRKNIQKKWERLLKTASNRIESRPQRMHTRKNNAQKPKNRR